MFDFFLANRSLLDINGGVLLVVLLLTRAGRRERAPAGANARPTGSCSAA